MNEVYLKGLNGLRAIASIAVLLDHINGALPGLHMPAHAAMNLAGYGVTIFFSLSGFLITYLLFLEKDQGIISIRNFYVRRILRIWPLYFLLLIVAVIIEGPENVAYYLFFIPNVPFVFGRTMLLLGHYWSLGVEEQFYFFWPWCIKYVHYVFRFFIVFIVFSVLLKMIFKYIYGGWSLNYEFVYELRFDCMAIGGIGAWVIMNRKQIVKRQYFRYLVFLSWIILAFVSFNRFHLFSIIDHEIIAVVTVILILDQAFGKSAVFNLDQPLFNYIGKLSYGIYMINPFVIFFLLPVFKDIDISFYLKYIFVYASVIFVTVLISHFLFCFFEMPFLSLKKRFSKVISTN